MDREKEIEEMRKIANDCDDHCGSPCTEYCIECIIKKFYDNGYRKIPDGAVVIHKDGKDRTEDELKWLVEHNAEVRKETAREIFEYIEKYSIKWDQYDENEYYEDLDVYDFKKFLKEKYGVEVE